jgi:hypothetical protein
VSVPLAAPEEIIDTSGVAPRIEALLPIGVRHRQLRVRALLAGMLLSKGSAGLLRRAGCGLLRRVVWPGS